MRLLANPGFNVELIVSGTYCDELASMPMVLVLPEVLSEMSLLDKPSLPLRLRLSNDSPKSSVSQCPLKLGP